jgi:hypothetical protein
MKNKMKFFTLLISIIFLLFSFLTYKMLSFDYVKLKKELSILKIETKKISNKNKLEIGEIFISKKILSNRNKDSFTLKKYYLPFNHYYANGLKSIGYIQLLEDKIIFTNAIGEFYYFYNKELDSKKINLINIPNNIKDLITDDLFYSTKATYSITDLEIFNGKLFVSYNRLVKHGCYNTSILVSDLNLDKLIFKNFFTYDECVDKYVEKEYLSHLDGGRMQVYKNNLLFTIGDYQKRNLGQDSDSLFGKVILINLEDKSYEIFSKGHRNPQGLLYLKDEDIVLETEHGPEGGDEINKLVRKQNYGWPISSYGDLTPTNYLETGRNDPKPFKSHVDHGFIEPIKYFLPSIGISQIIKVPKKFNNKENNIYVASMGRKKSKPYVYKAIFDYKFNENYTKILDEDEIVIGERIRDLIYLNSKNLVVMVLENSPSIAILKKN